MGRHFQHNSHLQFSSHSSPPRRFQTSTPEPHCSKHHSWEWRSQIAAHASFSASPITVSYYGSIFAAVHELRHWLRCEHGSFVHLPVRIAVGSSPAILFGYVRTHEDPHALAGVDLGCARFPAEPWWAPVACVNFLRDVLHDAQVEKVCIE